MSLARLAVKNVLRNRFRTALTIVGVAIAIVAFVLLRTVLSAWTAAADYAAQDRIATRHKVTFILPLPMRYVEDIRQTPGVTDVTWANWFGGKHPLHEDEFFATIAVDPKSFLTVYDEVVLAKEQGDQWVGDRRGAIVGATLARKFGWKVGDKVTLRGTIYPDDWDFIIDGIYTSKRKSIDLSTLWFHWDYLNERMGPGNKDHVGWIVTRIKNPSESANISKGIDATFDGRDTQTLTMSERAMNVSFLGMFSAVLKAINIVSFVLLLIMVLILGNTIAMGVRERTSEYGALRAIGFLPRHIVAFVVGEALTIGFLGGVLGLSLAVPLVNQGVGRFLEENMGGFFPYFRVEPVVAVAAFVISGLVGVLAAGLPAYGASKLDVVSALRRVG